jgi:hypothetical protein
MTRRVTLLGALLVVLVACDDESPTLPEAQPPELLPLTTPENLISNIEILYNDTERTVSERVAEFANLLAPPAGCDTCATFLFCCQEGVPDCWGRDEEIEVHRNLFQAQDDGDIFSLRLQMQLAPAEDLAGRPGWKSVLATNVHLRLMFNPNDGLEVNQGQAEFRLYPFQGRWYIGEWIELSIPAIGDPPVAVQPTTWGRIKRAYR